MSDPENGESGRMPEAVMARDDETRRRSARRAAPSPRTRRYQPPDAVRLLFLATIGMWLFFPLFISDNLAQDAVPFVVAGEMVSTHPDVVYASQNGDLFNLQPIFAERSCAIAPAGTDCSQLTVAFVSTPIAIPFAVAIASLGPTLGMLSMRVLGVACLTTGMWLLWRRLAYRARHAGHLLLTTVLLLTPFVMVPVSLGQTSEVMFLSSCIGLSCTDGRRRNLRIALIAALWVVAVALKGFPAILVLVLVWQRRWRFIGWAALWVGLLAGITLVLGPVSMWTDFVKASGQLQAQSDWNPYNGSLDALAHNLAAPITDHRAGVLALLAVRVGVAGFTLWKVRRKDHDTQWAVGYLVALMIVPLVWWHYLWLAVAALGVVLAHRSRLDDRTLAVFPVMAAIIMPISIPNGRGWSIPVAQGLFLLAAVGLAAWLALGHDLGGRRRERVPTGVP